MVINLLSAKHVQRSKNNTTWLQAHLNYKKIYRYISKFTEEALNIIKCANLMQQAFLWMARKPVSWTQESDAFPACLVVSSPHGESYYWVRFAHLIEQILPNIYPYGEGREAQPDNCSQNPAVSSWLVCDGMLYGLPSLNPFLHYFLFYGWHSVILVIHTFVLEWCKILLHRF